MLPTPSSARENPRYLIADQGVGTTFQTTLDQIP